MPLSEHVVSDYQTLRLSLKAHPLAFLRQGYGARGFVRAIDLRGCRFGQKVQVAGIVLIRQRPGSAKGVVFVTLEDESGVINLVIWPDTLARHRKTVMGARLMAVEGSVQMDQGVICVIARRIIDETGELSRLSGDLLRSDLARADHVASPLPQHSRRSGAGARHPSEGSSARHPRDVTIIPKSRDFH